MKDSIIETLETTVADLEDATVVNSHALLSTSPQEQYPLYAQCVLGRYDTSVEGETVDKYVGCLVANKYVLSGKDSHNYLAPNLLTEIPSQCLPTRFSPSHYKNLLGLIGEFAEESETVASVSLMSSPIMFGQGAIDSWGLAAKGVMTNVIPEISYATREEATSCIMGRYNSYNPYNLLSEPGEKDWESFDRLLNPLGRSPRAYWRDMIMPEKLEPESMQSPFGCSNGVLNRMKVDHASPWMINAPVTQPMNQINLGLDGITSLLTMEKDTGVLAKKSGVIQIPSIATQLAAITDVISSAPDFMRELVAPKSMLDDLTKVAIKEYGVIQTAGRISPWNIDVINSASYMVDRQIDWAAGVMPAISSNPWCNDSETKTENVIAPKVNIIAELPRDLEKERRKRRHKVKAILLEETDVYRIAEKGKSLINNVVSLNEICDRTGGKRIIECTNAILRAAATISGTVCRSRNELGEIVDSLFFFLVRINELRHTKRKKRMMK